MRRLMLSRTFFIMAAMVWALHGHAGEYPAKAFAATTKNAALQALFGSDRVAASPQLQIGFSAPNPEKQRVLIHLGDLQPQRVAILVTRQYKGHAPHGLIDPKVETPLVAVIDLTAHLHTPIEAYLQLALPSRIDVVAQVNDKLYGANTEIDYAYRGRMGMLEHGWAVPDCANVKPPAPLTPMSDEFRANVLKAQTVSGGGITQLELDITHPMETGWWFDWNSCAQRARRTLDKLQFTHGKQQLGTIWMGPGMGKKLVLLFTGLQPADTLSMYWHDTAGGSATTDTLITADTPKHYTALMYAALRNNPEWVKRILQAGTDINAHEGGDGHTALLSAAQSGHTEIVKLLLDHGADTEAAFRYGQTPLIWAAEMGQVEVVKLLLAKGAKPNVCGKGYMSMPGNTPLTATLRVPKVVSQQSRKQQHVSREAIVRALLAAGADVNAKATDGNTPLQIAQERNLDTIVTLLRQAGAEE